MRRYKVTLDGEIAFTGDQDGIALRHPDQASAHHIAEVLQQTWDAAFDAGLVAAGERILELRHPVPEAARPVVRANVRPETEEVYRKR